MVFDFCRIYCYQLPIFKDFALIINSLSLGKWAVPLFHVDHSGTITIIIS